MNEIIPKQAEEAFILSEHPFSSPTQLANSLVAYFAQPEIYLEEEMVFLRDGSRESRMVQRYRPLPLLEEFCATHRITTRELKEASISFPDTVGRAVEFARDVIKTYLVRKGLTEQFNPQFAKFVATNETGMVDRSESLNKNVNVNADGAEILDRIEKAQKPLRRQ